MIPCFLITTTAYSEHVGLNLQPLPNKYLRVGERVYL